MEVSKVCKTFIDKATKKDWKPAVLNLNGLSMYEMLRSLKALDAGDIVSLRSALTAVGGAVNAPRINYALAVVVNNVAPATAPGDLGTTGQVKEATEFLKKPTSILIEKIPKALVTGYNVGVSSAGNATMTARFGSPRATYSQACQGVTHKALARRMVTGNVGPFRVTGLDNAVSTLTAIMSNILTNQRLVYRALGNVGMLCARNVRGSTVNISNHSWGTAIDLTLDGVLDARGDDKIQFGLWLIAPIFNNNGWYWGAGFPTEDAQHFEVGSSLVQGW